MNEGKNSKKKKSIHERQLVKIAGGAINWQEGYNKSTFDDSFIKYETPCTVNKRLKDKRELEKIIQGWKTQLRKSIYDTLTANISALKANIQTLDTHFKCNDNKRKIFDHCVQLINEAYISIQALPSETKLSEKLVGDNFFNSISELLQNTEQLFSYRTHLTSNLDNGILSGAHKMLLYRIIKEAINNIVLHSKGSNIFVNLKKGPPVNILIVDDGIGFDINSGLHNGKGLQGIKHEVTKMKGTFTITSKMNEGTIIQVRFPL